MKMEQTECSETSAYKIQTPGNYLEENIQWVTYCYSPNARTWIWNIFHIKFHLQNTNTRTAINNWYNTSSTKRVTIKESSSEDLQ